MTFVLHFLILYVVLTEMGNVFVPFKVIFGVASLI